MQKWELLKKIYLYDLLLITHALNSARANKENVDWEIILRNYYVDCTTYLYLLVFLMSGSKNGTHILNTHGKRLGNKKLYCIYLLLFFVSGCIEYWRWPISNCNHCTIRWQHRRGMQNYFLDILFIFQCLVHLIFEVF